MKKARPLTYLHTLLYNIVINDRSEDSSIHSDPVLLQPTGVITTGNNLRNFSHALPKAFVGLILVLGLFLMASCGREAPYYEPGSIEVTSTPAGATIWLDGDNSGQITPYTFGELEANRYEISVVLDGFFPDPVSTTVDLHPAEHAVRDFVLNSDAPTQLTVTSTPAGAAIFIGGTDTGEVTPATISDVTPGDVEVQLALAGSYVSPASFTANVTANENNVLPADTFTLRWKKLAMMEGFSNVDCGGCPELADNLEAFMHTEGYGLDRAIYCKFSMSWPNGNDPFYQYNTAENNNRMTYYQSDLGSAGIPMLTIDGSVAEGTGANGSPTPTEIVPLIDAVLLEEPGFLIDVTADLTNTNIPVTVTLTAMEDVDLNGYTLYIALVQDYFLSEEAFQDVVDFHWLFRDRVNSSPALSALTSGETVVFNETLVRSDWDLETLHVLAFAQNNTTKEILQAGITTATDHAPASLFLNDKTNNSPTLGGNRP